MTLRVVLVLLALGLLGFLVFGPMRWTAPAPARVDELSSTASAPGDVDESGDSSSHDSGAPDAPVGDLHVRAVDPTSRTGLAGISCVVYESGVDPEVLATGTTDAAGSAHFARLAEGSVYVVMLRAPPRTGAEASVWIEDGTVTACEIEVGFGGALVGSVVDDTGAPMAGFELQLTPTEAERLTTGSDLGIPAGRTDAQGRFRVDAVESQLRWSTARKDDEAWWLAREPVGLWAGPPARLWSRHVPYYVLEGEEIDVGELVVDREQVHAGRVITCDGRPVAGALVSAHLGRQELDRDSVGAGFALLPGEVTTASDGSFELRVRRSRHSRGIGDTASVQVWTTRGLRARFALTELASGERVDGLVWTIEVDDALEIALLDKSGEPLDPACTVAGSFEVESLDRARAKLVVRRGEDGLPRAALPFPREELGVLRVRLRDYHAAEVRGESLRSGAPVSLHLEPLPRLHLALSMPAQEGFSQRSANVVVCRLPPDVRSQWGCCGAAVSVVAASRGRASRELVDVPVRAGPVWVYVTDDSPEAESTKHVYGPFEPSEETIELELPPLVRREEPPARKDGSVPRSMAEEVELYVVDASSGEPIEGASWWTMANSDLRGRLLARTRSDDKELELYAYGFVKPTIPLPETSRSDRVQLGSFALVREGGDAPRPLIRIVDRDRATPRSYFVRVLVAAGDGRMSVDGSWENSLLPLGARSGDTAWVLDADHSWSSVGIRRTTLPDPIPPDVVELELDVPIEVELQLVGMPEALLWSPLWLDVVPVLSGNVTNTPALERSILHDALQPSPSGMRTFRFGASPGDYVVTVRNRNRQIVPGFELLQIAVKDEPAVQAFELRFEEAR